MATALILALTLMVSTSTPPPEAPGEPLPAGAPTDPYQLTGWCYGALAEYLEIYDVVKPDLIAIDKMFGPAVKESEPYQSDIAAYRDELKIFGNAIEATEKASPQIISPQGAQAIRAGQSIWRPAEARTHRELARAWMSWGMPDQCDVNAKALLARSTVLGKALSFNTHAATTPAATPSPAQPNPAPTGDSPDGGALTLAPIAPIVTRDASAPGSTALTSAGATPPSSLPAAVSPVSAPPAYEPPPTGDVVAAARPARVIDEAASEPPAAAPTPTAAPTAPPPEAQPPVAAAPPPIAEPSAAPVPAPPRSTAPASDQSQEPVL